MGIKAPQSAQIQEQQQVSIWHMEEDDMQLGHSLTALSPSCSSKICPHNPILA